MNIGKAIKRTRERQGIARVALAEMASISEVALYKIEQRGVIPHPYTMNNICTALNMPEVFLVFMSIDELDIPEHKRDAYGEIAPLIESLINQ